MDNKQRGNSIDSKSLCAQNDIIIIEKAKIKGPIEKLFGIFFSYCSRQRNDDGGPRDCEKQPSIILKINSILTICLIIYSLHFTTTGNGRYKRWIAFVVVAKAAERLTFKSLFDGPFFELYKCIVYWNLIISFNFPSNLSVCITIFKANAS